MPLSLLQVFPTAAMISATSTGNVTLVDVDQDIIEKITSEKSYYISL
jgi:hypothetical protein